MDIRQNDNDVHCFKSDHESYLNTDHLRLFIYIKNLEWAQIFYIFPIWLVLINGFFFLFCTRLNLSPFTSSQ